MNTRRIKEYALLSSVVLPICLSALPSAAAAQTPEPAAQPASASVQEEAGGLTEIVVTAQRRAENLQKVPIAVSAFSDTMLEKMGIASVNELAVATPGLTMTQQRAALSPYLRGVGTVQAGYAEEGTVPVYLDGILVPNLNGAAFSFPSVERVEVLKGPQGTLFGRNSVGGLVNVITRDPSHDTSGTVKVGYGTFNTLTLSAYATGGLSDNVAADITAFVEDQGKGWGRNVNYGVGVNGVDQDSYYRKDTIFRSKLLFTPTDRLRVGLTGDYNIQRSTIGIERAIMPGALLSTGATKQGDYWDSQVLPATDPVLRAWSVSGRAEYDLDFAHLTSTTSYREFEQSYVYDQDATAQLFVSAPEVQEQNVWQQEFLLANSSSALDWTVGLFYFKSDSAYDSALTSAVRPPVNQRVTTAQITESYAAFAQGTYHLTSGTSITTGIRYTHDERTIDAVVVSLPGYPSGPGITLVNRHPSNDPTATLKVDRPTWRLSIDQAIGEDALVYASYNRGFKSGIFTQTGLGVTGPAVEPERIDAYEVGLKSEFADSVIRLNVAGFYYDYTNVQLSSIASGVVVNFNAPGSEIYGVDGELTFAPRLASGNLTITPSASYLHGRYKNFPNAPASLPLATGGLVQVPGINAEGNQTVRTPTFSGALTVSYEIPSSMGEFGITGTYGYTGKFYWEVDNRLVQRSVNMLNGDLSWSPADSSWRFSLWGKNLANEQYSVYTTANGTLGDLYSPAAPRTYGVTANYKF